MKYITIITMLIICIGCQQQDSKNFKFAVSGEFKPFSYIDKKGSLNGFDVEVGRLISAKLGLEAKPIRYKFAGMIEGLKAGRFDAAVASHTITEERKKFVNFSSPYYYSGPHVFSRSDAKDISLKDLEIAVSKGSTYEKAAKKYTNNIKVYDSDITALEALSKGRHQVVITDLITGSMAIKNGLENIHANQSLGASAQGIAIAKENKKLQDQINTALKEMRSNGTLKQLSMKYFKRDITSKDNSK